MLCRLIVLWREVSVSPTVNSESLLHQTSMFLDCGRKLDYQEKTYPEMIYFTTRWLPDWTPALSCHKVSLGRTLNSIATHCAGPSPDKWIRLNIRHKDLCQINMWNIMIHCGSVSLFLSDYCIIMVRQQNRKLRKVTCSIVETHQTGFINSNKWSKFTQLQAHHTDAQQ